MKRMGKIIAIVCGNLLVLALLLVVVEGVASFISVGRQMRGIKEDFAETQKNALAVAERHHTEYDPELGWINKPNVYLPDMYGPGKYLRTNAQRFRNNEDTPVDVPPGKYRIICSGDSFTLGYGVDNEHTWCAQLAEKDSHLDTVNMGQGGYGIDQAYLWYMRDGRKIRHDLQILAFITWDFDRMETDTISGYGKPVLAVRDGHWVTNNIPVPRKQEYSSWMTVYGPALMNLRTLELIQEMNGKDEPAEANSRALSGDTREVIVRLIDELHRANLADNSRLVILYLPTAGDYKGKKTTDAWRDLIRGEAQKRGWLYIDFFDEFRQLSRGQVPPLFIPSGVLHYEKAAGHYTDLGNAFISDLLYNKLMTIPEVADGFRRVEGR